MRSGVSDPNSWRRLTAVSLLSIISLLTLYKLAVPRGWSPRRHRPLGRRPHAGAESGRARCDPDWSKRIWGARRNPPVYSISTSVYFTRSAAFVKFEGAV